MTNLQKYAYNRRLPFDLNLSDHSGSDPSDEGVDDMPCDEMNYYAPSSSRFNQLQTSDFGDP